MNPVTAICVGGLVCAVVATIAFAIGYGVGREEGIDEGLAIASRKQGRAE